MENIKLLSSKVFLSEDNSNPDSYIAKFVICDFGRNKNGVALDRNHIDEWLSTLKNKPLVGKIKMRYDGEMDFTGHNMSVHTVADENGNEYQEAVFNTDAFGTFFDVSIEEIDGAECIVASCEIWKRFTNACDLIISRIQEGTLYTSWEISVDKARKEVIDGLATKVIEAGRFIGHCLLSKFVEPAYDSSRMLEIASEEEFEELEIATALSQDLSSVEDIKSTKEENELDNENVVVTSDENAEATTPVVEEAEVEEVAETKSIQAEEESPEVSKCGDDDDKKKAEEEDEEEDDDEEEKPETSSLTSCDLHEALREACRNKINGWGYISMVFPEEHYALYKLDDAKELDFLKISYTVNNDVVEIGEPEDVTLSVSVSSINDVIAEKDELIVKASAEINSLKAEITELSQYKEKFEQAEQERIAQELADKKEELIASVVKSGQITREEIAESTELSAFVDNLDKASLMALVGERLISSIEEKPETEISSVEETEVASINLNANDDDNEVLDASKIMRNFIGK